MLLNWKGLMERELKTEEALEAIYLLEFLGFFVFH